MNTDKIIINDPKKPTEPRRSGEFSITLFGWMFWLFLCRPLLVLLLWVMGYKFFYQHMITLKGIHALILFSANYLFIILFILVFLRGWNIYNRILFRGKEKRSTTKTTFFSETDRFFEMPEGSAMEMQNAKEVRVDFQPGGALHFLCEDHEDSKKLVGSLKTYFSRQ